MYMRNHSDNWTASIKTGSAEKPELTFDKIPQNFSCESSIESVLKNAKTTGIIFDSMEEVEQALRVYNGEISADILRSNQTTTQKAVDNLLQDSSLLSAGLFVAMGKVVNGKKDFVGEIIKVATASIEVWWTYKESWDYNGMGTNFFKTGIEIQEIGSRYLLNINAAYVGNKPEIELCEELKREAGCISASVDVSLSTVDQYWYNINIPELSSRFPFNITNIAQDLISQWENIEVLVEFNWEIIAMNVRLELPENPKWKTPMDSLEDIKLREIRDKYVVWGAWNIRKYWSGESEVFQPHLKISFHFPQWEWEKETEEYSSKTVVIVDENKLKLLGEIQEYLASFIEFPQGNQDKKITILDNERIQLHRKIALENSRKHLSRRQIKQLSEELCRAIRYRGLKEVQILIDKGANVNYRDKENGNTPIFNAVIENRTEIVKLLISHGADLHLKDHEGNNPLWYSSSDEMDEILHPHFHEQEVKLLSGINREIFRAIRSDNTEKVKECLDNGADKHCIDAEGNTLLHVACDEENIQTIRLLFEYGFNKIDEITKWLGHTPLMRAVVRKNLQIVKILVEHGVKLSPTNAYGKTALEMASGNQLEWIIKYLESAQKELKEDIVDKVSSEVTKVELNLSTDKNSRLVQAALNWDLDAIKKTLDEGANINHIYLIGDESYTALGAACSKGYIEIVTYLLDCGANIDVPDKNGHTPLYEASAEGQTDIVLLLLKKEANLFVKDKDGHTALHYACYSGNETTVKLLVENGIDLSIENNYWNCPIHLAVLYNRISIVDTLLRLGDSVERKSGKSNTPLGLAINENNLAMCKFLVENGALVNSFYGLKWETPLLIASWHRNPEMVTYLLDHWADINLQDQDEWAPIHLASCMPNNAAVVQILINRGANVNLLNGGSNALHFACLNNCTEIIQILIDNGINVNTPSLGKMRTPLSFAAGNNLVEIAQILIRNGALVNLTDINGDDALKYATEYEFRKMIKILRKAAEKELVFKK